MFDFNISDELRLKLRKLVKKDKKKVQIINKKIKEVINSDLDSINHYKNLKYGMKEFKRVHIDKHFVLVFSVNETKKEVIFEDFDHHDKIYLR